jgi:hypothetical protein
MHFLGDNSISNVNHGCHPKPDRSECPPALM